MALTRALWVPARFLSSFPKPNLNPALPVSKMLVNNTWMDVTTVTEPIENINPTTENVICEIPNSGKNEVDQAVEAAKNAFKPSAPWRRMNASKRGRILFKIADLLEKDAAYIGSLEAMEVGQLYGITQKFDVNQGVKFFRWMAGQTDKTKGSALTLDGSTSAVAVRQPLGVAALLLPFNFPLGNACIKIATALTAGCTAVVKPSSQSSLVAMRLVDLCVKAGLPPGVVNLVPGSGHVGDLLVSHPDVSVIAFTGSTQTGKDIYRRSADTMKRINLNLSGKNSLVVLPDVDIDNVVQVASTAALLNSGQCCVAASKTFVHESQYDRFVQKSKFLAEQLIIGDPFSLDTHQGPLASEQRMQSVLTMLEQGRQEGATVETGGARVSRKGFFVQPTVFSNLTDQMTISRQEVFGPVQQIYSYKTIEEVVERINDSEYGLAAGVFTNNIRDAQFMTENLQCGTIWVNNYFNLSPRVPFGGFKMSGLGRASCDVGVHNFCEYKSVHTELSTRF